MEEHHGRISVDSPPGGGASLTIELPRAAPSETRPAAPAAAEEAPAPPRHAILIVDDEPPIRALLKEVLSLDGHEVDTASTAVEALDNLARRSYDAVISDVRMPGMDGREFYQATLERDAALARRVIFISGDTVSRETRAFIEAADVPFLAKPFTVRDVREVVSAVIAAESPGQ
jgi:CheY-like chemotaxis protein